MRRHLTPWLFCAPILLVGFVFLFRSSGCSGYSFQRVGSAYVPSEFVGVDNYRYVYDDSLFWGRSRTTGSSSCASRS